MKDRLEGIGSIENSKILLNHNIQGDMIQVLRDTLKDIRKQIAEESEKYVGYPSMKYINPESGMSEDGFDCSGFVTYILQKFGVARDTIRHANEYFDSYGVNIHRELIQAGDLIFFSKDGLTPKHIGIVTSPQEYIYSPGKDAMKVKIQKIKDTSINNNSPGKIYSKNPIGFKRIILEASDNNFDYNGSGRERWKKIV